MKKTVLVLTAVFGFGMIANAQTPNETGGGSGMMWVSILALILLGLWYLYNKKRNAQEETKLNEIFQNRGFSNTELIVTKGSISPTGNFGSLGLENPTFNILIGVKDGVLSFFGGEYLGEVTLKNNAVIFKKSSITATWFLKKAKKFSHLFDIPISDIAEIVPQQKSKNVVILNIYEKSDKRTKLCFHYWSLNTLNIALANILMDAFEIILETGSISKGRISQINEDIEYACKTKGDDELKRRFFKGVGAVALVGAIVTGVAVSRSGRESFKYD